MKEQNSEIVMVDIKGLAEKLSVPLKEVRNALASGQLKPGIHYFLIGKEVRFQWGQKLIDKIHQSCASVTEKKDFVREAKSKDTLKKPCIKGRSSFDFSSLD